jgi:hypothetical protein
MGWELYSSGVVDMTRLERYIVEKESIMDKNPEYIIKDTKTPNQYIVTKWTHGKAPKDVYTISNNNNKWYCNCPAHKGYCKHIDLVKEWIKEGKPNQIGADFDQELKLFMKKYNVKI